MSNARILLVDDHDLFRAGLSQIIDGHPDFDLIGEARDGLEALKLARDLQPDLIVMDIQMPISDGIEATRLITNEVENSRIVMLTVQDDDEKLFAALKAGAVGYLLKSTNKADFIAGIKSVLDGETTLPPKMARNFLEEFTRVMEAQDNQEAEETWPDITSRESEVLTIMSSGASDKEIASQLSISVHTVKSHVRSILRKLQASNRRDAARLASQQGFQKNNKS